MLTSLTEYAKLHGRSGDTVRRIAERGAFYSAQKIGRNWVVDSDEEYPVRKRAPKNATKTGCVTVVSLFSGCGGMDLGFIGGFDFLGTHYPRTGFEVIWANDINSAACETYRQNIGDHILWADFNDVINQLPETADIVIGGFPCQDISINGKMRGIEGERSSLYTFIIETIKRVSPKVFVAENVGGLLLKQNEYSLNKILEDFNFSVTMLLIAYIKLMIMVYHKHVTEFSLSEHK